MSGRILHAEARPHGRDQRPRPPSTNRTRAGSRRSITGKQLFFYTLGDVLGSGIYVLIGLVAAAVGGAFWIAFAVGVTVAAITGTAYAELVTKYPQAAGAALYVNKAFGNKVLTFLITVCSSPPASRPPASLADGFSSYFATLWAGAAGAAGHACCSSWR